MTTCTRQGANWFGALVLGLAMLGLSPTSAAAQAEVVEYYATDAVGSIRVVFDAAGTVKGRSDYLPFGEALGSTGDLPNQRFTGQERDGEAGKDNFNARSMMGRNGRFASVDPLGGSSGNPQTWNRYAYVMNNPLAFTDPTGMKASESDHTGRSCWWQRGADDFRPCHDYGPAWDLFGGWGPDLFGGFGGFPYAGGEPAGGLGVDVGMPGAPEDPAPPIDPPTPPQPPNPPGPPVPPPPPPPSPGPQPGPPGPSPSPFGDAYDCAQWGGLSEFWRQFQIQQRLTEHTGAYLASGAAAVVTGVVQSGVSQKISNSLQVPGLGRVLDTGAAAFGARAVVGSVVAEGTALGLGTLSFAAGVQVGNLMVASHFTRMKCGFSRFR